VSANWTRPRRSPAPLRPSSTAGRRLLLRRQGLHGSQRLLDVLVRLDAADAGGDLAVRGHDERRALGESMVDLDATGVLHARLCPAYAQVKRAGDLAVGIRSGRKFSRAVVRILREVVQA